MGLRPLKSTSMATILRGFLQKQPPLPFGRSPYSVPSCYRFFSKPYPYIVKVGIPEFLKGVGKGVEVHAAKLETEIGYFEKLLVTRTLRLKKLGIPCKHRKLILKYTNKYRLGLWRPRAEAVKL